VSAWEEAAAIVIGCLVSAGIIAAILLGVRVVWLARMWADDRRREKEYADAWLRTHRGGRHE
jgi:hypothetical protein